MPNAEGKPTSSDIVNSYRLALGRDPESTSVIDEALVHAGTDWLRNFFRSAEFRENVLHRLVSGQELEGSYFAEPPPADLINWAASVADLSESTRADVRRSSTWPQLYLALFECETFSASIMMDEAEREPLLAELRQRSRQMPSSALVGEVEAIVDGEVLGWVIDRAQPDRVSLIELFVDGAFASAARAHIARGDLQRRFGGHGLGGFSLRFSPDAFGARSAMAEIREAGSGIVFKRFGLPRPRPRDPGAVEMVRRQLDELRQTLGRLEALLPSFHRSLGYDLASYDAYFEHYYGAVRGSPEGASSGVDLEGPCVLLDCTGDCTAHLGRALAALLRQTRPVGEIRILHDAGTGNGEVQAEIGRARGAAGSRSRISAHRVPAGDWSSAMMQAAADVAGGLVIVRGNGELSSEAISLLMAELEAGASMAYADEDRVCPEASSGIECHRDPIFRSAFDPEALLGQDVIGDLIAIRASLLREVGLRKDFASSRLYDLFLRLAEAPLGPQIRHVERVLFHRHAEWQQAPVSARMMAIEDHLARRGDGCWVEQHSDSLGATVLGATRVRHTLPARTKVAIIIPTRDRLDLLGPCVASLAAAVAQTSLEAELLVIDNQSADSSAKAFLSAMSGLSAIRLLSYDDRFNWALINNYAAAQTEADVAIFLNNDTVAIAPECWEALAAAALRPEVGAVGGRLLYEDGSIQHAGVVLGEWAAFATHEAVGAPGHDAGYLGRNALRRQVSTVTGACLATRLDLFRAMGGFDGALPVEGNETDYCLRLRSEGYRIVYEPGATLYHFESRSRGFNIDPVRQEQGRRSTELLRERWADQFQQDPFYNRHFDRSAPPFTRLQAPPPIK